VTAFRRLTVEWDDPAFDELERIARHEPRAAALAWAVAKRMGHRGYHDGRPTSEPGTFYRPPFEKGETLGLYYSVVDRMLTVTWVVDARTLRVLP
jgi:hypothetical protein